ncbi:guanine-specific ribonuclease N1 and T1 [Streptomyces sp. ISL-11]|nr:guanine-specific ribonuclease N1 and T1 [Streptomyces sp. ISL-11]
MRRSAAVAALLLAAVALPSTPAAAVPRAHGVLRPADVIDPPVSARSLPAQVKNACDIWRGLSWPTADRAEDYAVPDTRFVIRGSNVYVNRNGDLPLEGYYREYDVNPRSPGQRRDAERLVRDTDSHTVWYTNDHYNNFRRIASGCS